MVDEAWEARGQVLREPLAEILYLHGGKLRLRGVENGFLISVLSFVKESGLSRKELDTHLGLPEFQVDYLRQLARRRPR